MGGREHDPKLLAECAKVIAAGAREEHGCQLVGVYDIIGGEGYVALQKTEIEANVVADDGTIAHKSLEILCDIADQRGLAQHGIVNAGQAGYELRHVPVRVDKRGPLRLDAIPLEFDRGDLNDGIPARIQAGSLNIQGDERFHRTSVSYNTPRLL